MTRVIYWRIIQGNVEVVCRVSMSGFCNHFRYELFI